MKLPVSIFAISTLALSGTAIAADAIVDYQPVTPAPVVESPVFDWSGAYLGAAVGYVFQHPTEVAAFDPAGNRFSNRYVTGADGFVGGIFGGYNADWNGFVFGVEGDVDYADSSETRETFGGTALTSMDLGLHGSLRARMGYAFDRTLVYVTGGLAIADLEYGVTDATGSATNTSTKTGYTVGAGVDFAVTDALFLRGEYRFTDYGSDALSTAAATYDFDTETHIVKVGLGYKF